MNKLTAGDLRKLIEGKPGDWVVPVSIAYDFVCCDSVFVRLNEVTAGKHKPEQPSGNIHDDGPAIFITVDLVDGDGEQKEEYEPYTTVLVTFKGDATGADIARLENKVGHPVSCMIPTSDGNTDFVFNVADVAEAEVLTGKLRFTTEVLAYEVKQMEQSETR